MPAGVADASIATPEEAKVRHRFWSQEVGAVDALGNRALFDSLFPGYGEALSDGALWNRYFQEVFEQNVYSPFLMGIPGEPPIGILTSWLGSFDIFRKHGADVLIFGASDTFVSVSAGLLRRVLDATGRPELSGKKILQCGKGNLTPEVLTATLPGLEGGEKKAALAVWGYSLSYAHRTPYAAQTQSDLLASYDSWRERNAVAGFDRRFSHPSWATFLGPGLQELREQSGEGVLIPDAVAADPKAADDFFARSDASSYSIGLVESDCDLSAASREMDLTLAELLKVADKVLVFLPPTAPLNRRGAPACLLPNLQAMLRSKAGARVSVEAPDWDGYGLGYADFLYPAREEGMRRIDPYHVADSGTRKVTEKIAVWAAAALTSDGGAAAQTR